MGPRLWVSFLIFLSAYSPLSVILILQDFNFEKHTLLHPWFTLTYLFLSCISIFILLISIKTVKSSKPAKKIVSLSYESGQLVNYAVPYMITFFIMDLDDLGIFISFIFFLLLMFLLTVRTHNVFVNPILALFGYNLYQAELELDNKQSLAILLYKGSDLHVGDYCRIEPVSVQISLVTKVTRGKDVSS